MTITRIILLLGLVSLFLSSCGLPVTPVVTPTVRPTVSLTLASTATAVPSATTPVTATTIVTATATPSATTTASPTPTLTIIPSSTPTPTPIPTYTKLRGEVTIEQAVCHYGPGRPYLYKYGIYKGSNLEIIARVQPGEFVEIQAIGGNNPCWVDPKYMKIKGDLASLQPINPEDVKLPQSPYYAPPTGVSARRDGSQVTVFWNPLPLRPGDDSGEVPYVIEAFVCRSGQIVFDPVGAYQTAMRVLDEPGCSTPSYGWFTAAEKHGYTRRVKIPWPQP